MYRRTDPPEHPGQEALRLLDDAYDDGHDRRLPTDYWLLTMTNFMLLVVVVARTRRRKPGFCLSVSMYLHSL